eukprot:CAMPEP_0178456702 /NCGR_PEP_ID=MMETSP0689_2-20121128/46620_1 /TAXON_ID=160604 /ORGANISM="Amphidinium massartii, Strain CS-259" /LENGTH=112 /DNA_ID=CAMNT_0020082895 /DNA_START=622 /DNA_END=960 /DNA_ORIENTATION=-
MFGQRDGKWSNAGSGISDYGNNPIQRNNRLEDEGIDESCVLHLEPGVPIHLAQVKTELASVLLELHFSAGVASQVLHLECPVLRLNLSDLVHNSPYRLVLVNQHLADKESKR